MKSGAGLGNVRWLPLQPAERLNELLNLADVHLLPQRADAADLVMPSKLTGMLASGRGWAALARQAALPWEKENVLGDFERELKLLGGKRRL